MFLQTFKTNSAKWPKSGGLESRPVGVPLTPTGMVGHLSCPFRSQESWCVSSHSLCLAEACSVACLFVVVGVSLSLFWAEFWFVYVCQETPVQEDVGWAPDGRDMVPGSRCQYCSGVGSSYLSLPHALLPWPENSCSPGPQELRGQYTGRSAAQWIIQREPLGQGNQHLLAATPFRTSAS